jgi:MFS transporter, FHS family, glucose/mannose:H+ symporter
MRIKVALVLSYAVFAVLLNSVGAVILQSIEYFRVSKTDASTLEAFKDLPIAIASFLVASLLPRFGLRRGLMIALAAVAVGCAAMPLLDSFAAIRLLFVIVGCSFAIAKVATYAAVGLLTDTPSEHASLLNLIEGSFMLAVLGGYWLFGAFIDAGDPGSPRWLDVYWILSAACGIAVVALAGARLDEAGARQPGKQPAVAAFADMLRLSARPLTLVFVASLFLYVLVEQGLGTWLPTFNRQLLGLSAPMSVQAASLFALSLAIGRLAAGAVVRRTGWYPLLVGCLLTMAALILVALPLADAAAGRTVEQWRDVPTAAFVLPLIGLAMAPIYPMINSAVLGVMPKSSHAAMVGLIVVFSALGGTTGSLIVGRVFAATQDTAGFYLLLVPVGILLAVVMTLRNLTRTVGRTAPQA